ncbi:hypothetical protein FA13DRAFT_1725599 [Coprinellus micaceus]|uniref:Uncharacterized protein n=1 Tax=Coprinellus micaceus TaxID=71717 RepID=A0A4Y7TWH6_COPMI|nr:hypothetical protein FA13DRAFT_1728103 [Coprinellus micaceus]TEB37972.1 hypothetical protein FA13DRAFT_1725599 [Coprinellus micaceus]
MSLKVVVRELMGLTPEDEVPLAVALHPVGLTRTERANVSQVLSCGFLALLLTYIESYWR